MLNFRMSLVLFLLLMSMLMAAAGSAFAACPDDVYFKSPQSFQLSVPIGYARLGDVDGDGRKDLIGFTMSTQRQTNPVNIVVYKRSATGFDIAPVVSLAGTPRTRDFDLVDTNNDGKLDIVNFGDNNSNETAVTTYLGDGAGGFTLGPSTAIGYLPNRSYGDLNGDGRPDLVASWNSQAYYSLMNADGTFGTFVSLGEGTYIYNRDFNNDGKNDILLWHYDAAKRKILFNQGNAQFTPGPAIPDVASAFVTVGDLNGDGRLDIVTDTYVSGANTAFSYFLQQSNGGFVKTEKIIGPTGSLSTYSNMMIADADGDGDNDLLIFGARFSVGVNDGAGQFTLNTRSATYDLATFGGNLYPTLDQFDGDGRADLISVNREMVYKDLSDVVKIRQNTCAKYGQTKYIDFDGDNVTDMAYFRASDGQWLYRSSISGTYVTINGFGTTGDIPVPQDYDADSITDRALFRPSTGTWYVMASGGGYTPVQWGSSGDKPVPSDYDGDGKADLAIYRPSNGTWWVLNSSDGSYNVYTFGTAEDIPLPMDYDGDGKSDIAVFRPSTGDWYIQKSTGNYYILHWGLGSDIPVPADYDNDGQADLGVYRPSTGYWYYWRLRDSVWYFGGIGGGTGDVPVPFSRPAYGTNIAVYKPGAQQLWEANQSVQSLSGFGSNRIVSTILPN
jgi:hypothetical protein